MEIKVRRKVNRLTILVWLMVILILVSTGLTYAIFSARESFDDWNLGSGNIAVEINKTGLSSSNAFNEIGSTYVDDIIVKNTGSCAFSYSLELAIVDDGLINAVLLSVDNTDYGVLSKLIKNNKIVIDIPMPLASQKSATHKIKLEYHIGASQFYKDKKLVLNYKVLATQLSVPKSEFLLINNAYQLEQAIAQITKGNYIDKTILLTNDIVLEKDIVISVLTNINLNGFSLDLNNKSLSFTSFKGDGKVSNGVVKNGSLNIDTTDGFVLFDAVNLDTTLNIINVNKDLLIKTINESISTKFSKSTNSNVNIFGNYSMYASKFVYSFTEESNSFDIDGVGNLTIKQPFYTILDKFILTIDGRNFNYDIEIIGQSSNDVAEEILKNNFLNQWQTEGDLTNTDLGSEQNPIKIDRDIFLPLMAREANASIIWVSSDEKILTQNGQRIAPYMDTKIELTAIVDVNGGTLIKKFHLLVYGKTPQERLKEATVKCGALTFTKVNDINDLPTAKDSVDFVNKYEYLGFEEFTFGINELNLEVGNIFTLNENRLKLIKESSLTSMRLKIIGKINNVVYEDYIAIKIALLKTESIFVEADRYIQSYFNALDGATLKGFNLPSFYKDENTLITYDIFAGEFEVFSNDSDDKISLGTFSNPANIANFLSVTNNTAPLNSLTNILTDKLPTINTQINVVATISHQQLQLERRVYQFDVKGIIKYGNSEIADASLYQTLVKIFDLDLDGYMTFDEIDEKFLADEFVKLTINNKNITTLKGLEYFNKFKYIDLGHNRISDISALSNFYQLETLLLNNNNIVITNLLNNLTVLKELDLSNNDILSIDSLEKLQNLKSLKINNNNNIIDLAVIKYFTNLYEFYCYNTNAISTYIYNNEGYCLTSYQNAVHKYDIASVEFYLSASVKYAPITQLELANNILNSINPIYEFRDVIYIPFNLNYNGINYQIAWGTNFTQIVTLNSEKQRAYITQPIADLNIYLIASVKYRDEKNTEQQLYRYIKILSRGDTPSEQPTIEVSNGVFNDSVLEIPDSTLRYYIYLWFDTDINGILTQAELNAAKAISIKNLNIASLKGIEHCQGITIIDISNNPATDIQWLNKLANVYSITLSGQEYDFAKLYPLTHLASLNVYGCIGFDKTENLAKVYTLYLKNNGNLNVYTDSNSEIKWDPFKLPIAKALSNLESGYILEYGQTITLPSVMEVVLYDGSIIKIDTNMSKITIPGTTLELGVDFAFDAINLGLISGENNDGATTISFDQKKHSAVDQNKFVAIKLVLNGTTFIGHIQIVVASSMSILVTNHDGTTAKLYDVLKDETARGIVLSSYTGSNNIITRAMINTINTLTFDCSSGFGLIGIELFKGSNVNTLNINGFSDKVFDKSNNLVRNLNLTAVTSANFPKLTALFIRRSNVNLFDLSQLTKLEKLELTNCFEIIMSKTENGESISAFSTFEKLSSLKMAFNNINNFIAIKGYSQFAVLHIYGNPASLTAKTQTYVQSCYDKFVEANPTATTFEYRIKSIDTLWKPDSLINNVITDFRPTYNGKILSVGRYSPNYIKTIDGVELKLALPTKYTLKSGDTELNYDIVWSTKNSGALDITTGMLTNQAQKSFITLSGYVKALKKTIEYFIILDGQQSADSANYLDLREFMYKDSSKANYDTLIDINFVYALFNGGASRFDGVQPIYLDFDKNGLIKMSDILAVDTIKIDSKPTIAITDITGINVFINLDGLYLDNCPIEDISAIAVLTRMSSLSVSGNSIKSLRFETDKTINGVFYPNGRSIFYDYTNLAYLTIGTGTAIQDYIPITEMSRKDSLNKLSQIVIYPNGFEDSYNVYPMFKEWWSYRKNTSTGNDKIRFGNKELNKEIAGTAAIDSTLNKYANLYKISGEITLDSSDSNKTAFKPIAGETIQNTDMNFETTNILIKGLLSFKVGGEVNSINVELSNGRYPLRVFYTSGAIVELSRIIYANVNANATSDETTLNFVEVDISATGMDRDRFLPNQIQTYYDKVTAKYINVVNTTIAIPDQNFLTVLFSQKTITTAKTTLYASPSDTTGLSCRVITLVKRASLSAYSLTATNTGIIDITGFDLFLNLTSWAFEGNSIIEFPKIYIPKNFTFNGAKAVHKLKSLKVKNDKSLRSIENFVNLDTRLNSADYYNYKDIIETLEMESCYGLSELQLQHLTQFKSLKTLRLINSSVTDLAFILELKNLATIYTYQVTHLNANDMQAHFRDWLLRGSINKDKVNLENADDPIATEKNGKETVDKGIIQLLLEANRTQNLYPIINVFKDYLFFGANVLPKNIPLNTKIRLPMSLDNFSPNPNEHFKISWNESPTKNIFKTSKYTITLENGVSYLQTYGEVTDLILYPTLMYSEDGINYQKTYTEKLEMETSIESATVENEYEVTTGFIDVGSDLHCDIVDIVPDKLLRYYFFKFIDLNHDGYITNAELAAAKKLDFVLMINNYSEGATNYYINCLKGIELLQSTEELYISGINTYDLSYLGGLKNLKKLTLFRSKVVFDDFDFLYQLTNLKTLSLLFSGYSDCNFLMNMPELTDLDSIDNSFAVNKYARYVRNAWAYARAMLDLTEQVGTAGDLNNQNGMASGDLSYESSDDEKIASLVLDSINFDKDEQGLSILAVDRYTLLYKNAINTLPLDLHYKGDTYVIKWKSLSVNATFDKNKLTINNNDERKTVYIVATIKYNGGSYEKLFRIRL